MRIGTRRDWALSGRYGPDANARRVAAAEGRPVAMVNSAGRITIVEPGGKRHAAGLLLSRQLIRVWRLAGWPGQCAEVDEGCAKNAQRAPLRAGNGEQD